MSNAWFFLGSAVQLTVSFVFPKRLGKGRLTRWISRYRPFKPPNGVLFGGLPGVRLKQIIAIVAPASVIDIGLLHDPEPVWWSASFWPIIIVLYLDDYLTGDDDRWRRFKDAVRNKVRWKMALSAPPQTRGGTA